MALYCYKKQGSVISAPPVTVTTLSGFGEVRVTRFLPFIFILAGLFFISLVIYPLLSYKLTLNRWKENKLAMPVPEISIAEAKGLVTPLSEQTDGEDKTGLKVIDQVDYNLINNWFPQATIPEVKPTKVTHYNISIPKLKIDKAVVTIGGKKLFDTLIHYPGTALPGGYGNTIIFGHSVLPTFYSPGDYRAIFSLIPTLEKGDKILVDFDGMQFTYTVEDYFEKKPEEIDILEQRFDRQLLSLVTCVPPGTYLRRGIIVAQLEKI